MMRKESKCPRGVYKVKTYGTLQMMVLLIPMVFVYGGASVVVTAIHVLKQCYEE